MAADTNPDQNATVNPDGKPPVRIVAIGASAGGLEPFEQFFDEIPGDTQLAFVVVQHLSPNFKSMMDEILSRHSTMTIKQIENGTVIEPNTIYLNQPRLVPTIDGNSFHVTDTSEVSLPNLPINIFFESLARNRGKDAIGVIFSGTGSDGTKGCEIISNHGGMIFVQEPTSAKFDGMLNSVINRHLADHIAPPRALAALILAHAKGEDLQTNSTDFLTKGTPKSFIFRLLLDRFGTDFRHYKDSTIERRIRRRFGMRGLSDIQEYADLLAVEADELSALYDDLLIDVTAFFRDKEAFEALEKIVIPEIAHKMDEDNQVRVWVPACSSGEEPYSIAILLAEYAQEHGVSLNMKIMATDIHSRSLEAASEGIYDESSLSMMSSDRINRYFVKRGNKYQIIPEIRRSVVFSPHNLFVDPPFTRMDLVSCRNMLIYLQEPAQHKGIALFHFSVRKEGYIFLGPSETVGKLQSEFETINQRWRIFRKKRDVRLVESTTVLRTDESPQSTRPILTSSSRNGLSSRSASLDQPDVRRAFNKALQTLLSQYAPAGFLITRLGELVHIFGDAGEFINVSSGGFSQRLIDLVHEDLKIAISAGLERMKGFVSDSYTRRTFVTFQNGDTLGVTISMEGLPDTVGTVDFLLVTVTREAKTRKKIPPIDAENVVDLETMKILQDRIHDLERDLSSTEESLQTTIEELETSNEELQATNEELMASNEELQSTNEELHSVNEELYTVSSEHQRKIEELTELTNDMDQLLRSTDIGTIFLNSDLEIRRFTEAATATFNLYPQDVGRPLEHITHKFDPHAVSEAVRMVQETLKPVEVELDVENTHYLLRVLPYKSNLGKTSAIVIVIIDVNELRQAAKQIEETSYFYSQVLGDITDFVIRWEVPSGKVTYLNETYKEFVEEHVPDWDMKNLYDLVKPDSINRVRDKHLQISANETLKELTKRPIASGRELYFSSQTRSVGDTQGNVTELQWTGHDVTEEIKYQNALQALLSFEDGEDHTFGEKINKILKIGTTYFGLEFGTLLRLDDKDYCVDGYVSPDKKTHQIGSRLTLPDGNVFAYVLENDDLLSEADMAASEHKAFAQATRALSDCKSFIGLPIRANNEIYGVLGFYTKSERRASDFTPIDNGFIKLLSRWIGFKIESRDHLEVLTRNKAELQFIFDNMPARIWYKDDENKIIRLNKQAADSMGVTVEDATGADTYELFPEMAKKYHEDDLRVFEKNKPLVDIIEEYTPRDGERGWVSTNKIPFEHTPTDEKRLLVVSIDITSLKEQETLLLDLNEQLEEQRQHFRSLYRKTPVMMHSFNRDAEILEVSDQWLQKMGYQRDEVIGQTVASFMTKESQEDLKAASEIFWDEGSVTDLPFRFIQKDGTEFEVEVSGLVDDTSSKTLRSLGVLIDVTERNRARAELQTKNIELERAIERLSQFAYVASHDLQEPLRKIQQFSELLQEDCKAALGDEGEYFLSTIMQSSERMSLLIRALLQYSRASQGDFAPQELDLNEILKEAREELDQRIEQAGADVSANVLPKLQGDKVLIRQLLINLISNGIKYGADKRQPKIEIKWTAGQSRGVLSISDNGIGIAEQYLEHIFEPFTRLGGDASKKGSGIGLAICKSVCDRHGWTIKAESTVGIGTTFLISVPNT